MISRPGWTERPAAAWARNCRRVAISIQILGLPAHGGRDARPPAGMIEQHPLLQWTWLHLAVFAQLQSSFRKTVGLPAGVQSENISLCFPGANIAIGNGGKREEQQRKQKRHQRYYRDVADSFNIPACSPFLQRPIQDPAQIGKRY